MLGIKINPLRGGRGKKKRSVVFDESVELCEKLFNIDAVNGASHLYGLAAGSRATKAMHTDLKEKRCGLGSDVKDIADNRFSGDLYHFYIPSLSFYFDKGCSFVLFEF